MTIQSQTHNHPSQFMVQPQSYLLWFPINRYSVDYRTDLVPIPMNPKKLRYIPYFGNRFLIFLNIVYRDRVNENGSGNSICSPLILLKSNQILIIHLDPKRVQCTKLLTHVNPNLNICAYFAGSRSSLTSENKAPRVST